MEEGVPRSESLVWSTLSSAHPQVTQFKLADMAMKVHTSRLVIRSAARELDDKAPGAPTLCAMAKVGVCVGVLARPIRLLRNNFSCSPAGRGNRAVL